jgi:hypothetical protein
MRDIIKIEIFKNERKARIFDANGLIDTVEFNHIPSGYVLFRSFIASDMCNIKGFNYYDDINEKQKLILDNLEEIKVNLKSNIKSYDFISNSSALGKFTIPVKKYNNIV